MAKAQHVDEVSCCEDCPFFSDDDRNGPQCGCPRPPPVERCVLKYRYTLGVSRVVVSRDGAKCPLLTHDVLVQRRAR